MNIADRAKENSHSAYAANVRTFANGRDYEFDIDFNKDAIDVSNCYYVAESVYYFSDVAKVLLDFVEGGESYRVLNASDAFIQAVRREAKRRNLAIWFGFPKDQFGNPANTAERLLTLRENAQ